MFPSGSARCHRDGWRCLGGRGNPECPGMPRNAARLGYGGSVCSVPSHFDGAIDLAPVVAMIGPGPESARAQGKATLGRGGRSCPFE